MLSFEHIQAKALTHPPRILLLYASKPERSYSCFTVLEAGRLLERIECEVKTFHPKRLLLSESVDVTQPKVEELYAFLAYAGACSGVH